LAPEAGDLRLEHDDQVTDGVCADCGGPYESVIGVIYEREEAIAIYRADIFDHFHRDPEPRVVLMIAAGEWQDGTDCADRCSAAIEAWADGGGVRMAFTDRARCPWQDLEVVGWQLSSHEAEAAGPLREAFLRLAGHVARHDRRLRRALSTKAAAPPNL
jgi:predicted deacylase